MNVFGNGWSIPWPVLFKDPFPSQRQPSQQFWTRVPEAMFHFQIFLKKCLTPFKQDFQNTFFWSYPFPRKSDVFRIFAHRFHKPVLLSMCFFQGSEYVLHTSFKKCKPSCSFMLSCLTFLKNEYLKNDSIFWSNRKDPPRQNDSIFWFQQNDSMN